MKMLRILSSLVLLLVALAAICLPGIALAQDEETPKIQEKIKVSPLYPRVESIAGGDFVFNVEFAYIGAEPKAFDIRFSPPPGWDVYMTPRYEKDKKISSVTLKPTFAAGEEFLVTATAPFWPLPDPGEYRIGIEAISETISGNTNVTAEVTAKYYLQTTSANERLNTTAGAGKDNVYSIVVTNLSTAPVDNIQFSSKKPDGWSIKFTPDKIDIMDALDQQTVDVTIAPPPKAVAGDYNITIQASGKQITASEMNVRVTVETATIWGWVGVAIIVVVVAALIVIFMRFSRR
ncbi:MAG: NEW3 domain-containing protein [Chloroflexota bacterium]